MGCVEWLHYPDDCVPSPEVCNGEDDDCNGTVDDGDVCLMAEEVALGADSHDPGSTTDVDGDGRADICASWAGGFECRLAREDGFPERIEGPELSDADGWGDRSNYATIRMGDINGDGLADVCARSDTRYHCWPSNGAGFDEVIDGPEMSDTEGWVHERYYTTIRLADFTGDGMDDICARAGTGMVCFESTGTGFGEAYPGPELSDALGWADEANYGTIRTGDINGDRRVDICARGGLGIFCWTSMGAGFDEPFPGPELSDAADWSRMMYWSTIRLADFTGDGMDDLCARAAGFVVCYPSTGAGFGDAVAGPQLGNDLGWADYSNYSTFRMADVTGDGREDICARGDLGIFCWPSTDAGFGEAFAGPELSDALGWNDPTNYRTIRMADVDGNGMADICARGDLGIVCWLADGTGFPETLDGPEWSDAEGWATVQYYATVRAAGPPPCIAAPEECNNEDDDCDGEVDEEGCDDPDAGFDADVDAGGALDGGDDGGDADGETSSDWVSTAGGGCGCRAVDRAVKSAPLRLVASVLLCLLLASRRYRSRRRGGCFWPVP